MMRKILSLLIVLIPAVSFAQVYFPNSKYGQKENRTISFVAMGVPNDTTNIAALPDSIKRKPHIAVKANVLYLWDTILYKWNGYPSGSAGTNIYNSNGILTGNRTLTGLNNTYSLTFDSLNSFLVKRNGLTRFEMTSAISRIYSPDQTAYAYATNGEAGLNNDNSNIIVHNDDSIAFKSMGGVYQFRHVPIGPGTKALRMDANGKITVADTTAGTGVSSLTATYVGFGDGSNLLTGEAAFNYDAVDDILNVYALQANNLLLFDFNSIGTPPSGWTGIYSDSHGRVYSKNDANTIVELTNTAAAGAVLTKSLTMEFPGAAESFGVWRTPIDITIDSISAVLVGSSTPSVTLNFAFGSNRTSGTNVFTSGQTATSTTTGHLFSSGFNDATIPAGNFIWFTTSAQSGTVTQIEITIYYTED